MKSYTDLEQSRKLSEFLPIENTDMYYPYFGDNKWGETARFGEALEYSGKKDIPCWSLAALLDYLSANYYVDIKYLDEQWELNCRVKATYNKELVDACFDMIVKLHELNIL